MIAGRARGRSSAPRRVPRPSRRAAAAARRRGAAAATSDAADAGTATPARRQPAARDARRRRKRRRRRREPARRARRRRRRRGAADAATRRRPASARARLRRPRRQPGRRARRRWPRRLEALAALPGTRLVARSSLYRSAPVDAGGPDYLNAVAALDTALAPLDAAGARCRPSRPAHGRERPYPQRAAHAGPGPAAVRRQRVCDTPALTLPHPRLHLRAFVLRPLAELAPDLILARPGPAGALARARSAGSGASSGWSALSLCRVRRRAATRRTSARRRRWCPSAPRRRCSSAGDRRRAPGPSRVACSGWPGLWRASHVSSGVRP